MLTTFQTTSGGDGEKQQQQQEQEIFQGWLGMVHWQSGQCSILHKSHSYFCNRTKEIRDW